MKKCTKCNEIKPRSEFGNHKKTKDKLQCHCKLCIKLNSKVFNENNPNWSKDYYLSRQSHYKNKASKRYKDNKEEILIKQSKYYFKNKTSIQEHYKKWVSINRDKINEYNKERRANNPSIKLAGILRSKISTNVRKVGSIKDQTSLSIVGLDSWDSLKDYIESQFEEGMSWSNYGIGPNNTTWHIDHKIPISSAHTLEEVKKLNHYTNLRPMWGSDNIRKSNKIFGD